MKGNETVNKKVLSEIIELIGLIVLLAASSWQIFFTDWWDDTANDWQFNIIRDMQSETLNLIGELSLLVANYNNEDRINVANEINIKTAKAMVSAVVEKERRQSSLEGQAKTFKVVRIAFFFIGSIIMITGKCIKIMDAKSNNGMSMPTNEIHSSPLL